MDNKFGYVDSSGKEVISLNYDEAYPFSDGLAAVKQNGKYGFINKSGKSIIPITLKKAKRFESGLAPACDSSGCGYIDKKGNRKIPFTYEGTKPFNEGFATVVVIAATPQPDDISKLPEYLRSGRSDVNQCTFIDKTGKQITKYKYHDIDYFIDGFAIFKLFYKYGVINNKGEVIIEPEYHDIGYFNNGLAQVVYYKESKLVYGYVDKKGNKYFYD